MPLQTQTVTSAGTTITYKKKKRKPELSFAGPTNAVLKVVVRFVCVVNQYSGKYS